jgi:hypothetical protein
MLTRYVGVFCAGLGCRHFIVLDSHEASPNILGMDVEPPTSGITCPKCGLTCHYRYDDIAHSESPDGKTPRFQNAR